MAVSKGSDSAPPVQPNAVKNLAGPGGAPDSSEFSVYITCGTEISKGTVYQTDDTGRVVATVTLPYTATGLALHRNRGLVAAIPRDGGKILKIDERGMVSTILERDRALLHPVRVGVPGESDLVVVADDISKVVAATTTEGATPTVYQRYTWQKATPEMSVAVTRDKHVVFGTDGSPGVYRYASEEHSAASKPLLPGFGRVAADPRSLRWAAAQESKESNQISQIYVFEGEELSKKLRLPPNKTLYRDGLMSFSPGGSLCVAVEDSEKPKGEVLLLMYDFRKDNTVRTQRLFTWTRGGMNDFVVGPPMPWGVNSPAVPRNTF